MIKSIISYIILIVLYLIIILIIIGIIIKYNTHKSVGKISKLSHEFRNKKLDFVYLWVDMNDPKWLKRKINFLKNRDLLPTELNKINDNKDINDYRELEFSIKNTLKYTSKILKNIYIVTDDQIPKWYNSTLFPQIKLIDIKSILPLYSLPCYNSDFIETFIHKIPNISNWFIYMNDDMFINKEINHDNFFISDNIARFNNDGFGINPKLSQLLTLGKSKTVNSRVNSDKLCKTKDYRFDKYHVLPAHTPLIVNVKLMEELNNIFEKEIYTNYNNIRSNNSLVLLCFIYPHYAIYQGYGLFTNDYKCFYMTYSKYNLLNKLQYQLIDKITPDYFTINDTRDSNQNSRKDINYNLGSKNISKTLTDWLQSRINHT